MVFYASLPVYYHYLPTSRYLLGRSRSEIWQLDCFLGPYHWTCNHIYSMTKREWSTYERQYCIDHDAQTFTKTEIHHNTNARGERTTPWKSTERIKNEYYALRLVKKNTTIPVPQPLLLEKGPTGWSVTMEYVAGTPLDELPENIRAAAVQNADRYINDLVLPQLAKLKSRRSGALTGDVIPPRRVIERYPGKKWTPVIRTQTQSFVFCHGDLGQHNILCDPSTGNVVSIIDWEYAGYYDQFFEGRLWLKPFHETEHDDDETALLERSLTDEHYE
ncbi:hypothetical protein HRR90_003535 [Exophiala dermatitidis]|nr:hypothetical protein HRR79_000044 [Exophiala dermatitidis]KAJ4584238.1 hypothetical protein HRR81_000044 [Exophiala dermatitidis]KAJ4590698.1 hypothetical protein HRR82_001038 [Exophiala dermatitidis]KAJ4607736.1 hypothetical protein HRR84_001040 [Exophiala dermatitidis]KAJ4610734.1 hypothetical protein HRR85_005351 [Exophiala dermatitidis]